jgi:hypothetical protein
MNPILIYQLSETYFWFFFLFNNETEKHTDKKENQIFLIYKEIQMGSFAKSYMSKASSYMVKYFLKY